MQFFTNISILLGALNVRILFKHKIRLSSIHYSNDMLSKFGHIEQETLRGLLAFSIVLTVCEMTTIFFLSSYSMLSLFNGFSDEALHKKKASINEEYFFVF